MVLLKPHHFKSSRTLWLSQTVLMKQYHLNKSRMLRLSKMLLQESHHFNMSRILWLSQTVLLKPYHLNKSRILRLPKMVLLEPHPFNKIRKLSFNYYGKSATPYFEAEIKAMKIRNLYEMSIHYNDIHHDCEELAIVIRDHYDSVLEDLRGSLVKYLVAHAVEVKMAEEAVLKIHGRPIR
ncbi:hypothetical protein SETIT_7G335600v2 [Setaria italica]|uniref:Uncharacterized protein n=2 Tax=Setaria TaxID=4554 RepID=A0A368S2K0_SETIT|nr:hypothetical protein SETIT_7G335600v2 [Setaria italica]